MIKITCLHWKWIRFDSQTNHRWERQRMRSWATVLSLKCPQFLSFSENRNNSRLLRTFNSWELEYTPLRCFLIESARRLQREGSLGCWKSVPVSKADLLWKEVSLPSVPIGRDPGAGSMLACGQGSAELPFKSLFLQKKTFQHILRCLWLKTVCFLN